MKPSGRFYPILDRDRCASDAPRLAGELVEAGCGMLQVRAKNATSAELFDFARPVVSAVGRLCRVIINDRFDVALALGASGVHLGEHDLPPLLVRANTPEGFIIGVTCREVREAVEAEKNGADYLGAGAVFATGSKPDTRLIGLKGLAAIAGAVSIPVYGIAGITLQNCGLVIKAGAYGCAGITAVSGSTDPTAAYRLLEKACREAAI